MDSNLKKENAVLRKEIRKTQKLCKQMEKEDDLKYMTPILTAYQLKNKGVFPSASQTKSGFGFSDNYAFSETGFSSNRETKGKLKIYDSPHKIKSNLDSQRTNTNKTNLDTILNVDNINENILDDGSPKSPMSPTSPKSPKSPKSKKKKLNKQNKFKLAVDAVHQYGQRMSIANINKKLNEDRMKRYKELKHIYKSFKRDGFKNLDAAKGKDYLMKYRTMEVPEMK